MRARVERTAKRYETSFGRKPDALPSELATWLERERALEGWNSARLLDAEDRPLASAGVGHEDPASNDVIRVPVATGTFEVAPGITGNRTRLGALFRLFGLYMGLIGLLVLLLASFALTRWIVRPLDALARASERVATGARRLDAPGRGAKELMDLSQSLVRMTEVLRREEEAQRRRVDEVEQATLQLREAQDSLVRSERLASVGRLAAGLAHEVGNPLAALMGMQDLLLETDLSPEEHHDFLRRMRKETERIHSILRDLLDFARPRAEGPDGAPPAGDVSAAIMDTVALVSPQPALSDVDLSLDVYPELPAVALTEEQLVQVLLNLILNAADACANEPGAQVTVRAFPKDASVFIEVEDNGPGIPASIQDRLFEPFVTTKEVGKGTGRGLAVCRGLVVAAGGELYLDTTKSSGARFVMKLPVVAAP
jgi:signal transduction histidine kinase